jgi:hypothetical protein
MSLTQAQCEALARKHRQQPTKEIVALILESYKAGTNTGVIHTSYKEVLSTGEKDGKH